MTALSVVQEAAPKIGVARPSQLFGATDSTSLALQAALNEAAVTIRDEFDWQRLRTVATVTGDGNYEAFDLPSDYARMLKKTRFYPSDQPTTPIVFITDTDKWLELEVSGIEEVTRRATIYANQLHLRPILASGSTVKYVYIGNNTVIVDQATAPTKAAFDADSDCFALDERLLRLCLIWQWKAARGRPYAQDQQDYTDLLDKRAERDRGPRVLHIGGRRSSFDANLAYPGTIEE